MLGGGGGGHGNKDLGENSDKRRGIERRDTDGPLHSQHCAAGGGNIHKRRL